MEAPHVPSPSDAVKTEEICNNDENLSEVKDNVQMDNESSDEDDCENSLTIADDDDYEDTQKNQKNDDTTQERAEENHTDNTADDKSRENDTSNSTTQEAVAEEEKHPIEENIKQLETQIPKLNGNHCLSLNDVDESSCSSSTSSGSSHNLVIDHPLAEEIPPKLKSPAKEDTGCLVTEGKSLKRRLSICENGSPQHKRSYLDFPRGSPQKHLALDFKLNQAEPDHEIVQPPVKTNEANFLSPVRSASFWESSIASQYPQETPEPDTNLNEEVTKSPLSTPSFWQTSLQAASRTVDKVQNMDEVEIRNSPRTSNACEQNLPTPSPMAVPEATEKNFEEFVRSPPNIHNIWEKMLAPTHSVAVSVSQSPSPYEQYALFSDNVLPAPKLNFECFKCKQAEFDNFTKLRDHHKVCLFKENHKKVPRTSTSSPTCQVVVAKSKPPSAPLAQPSEPPPPAISQTKKRFYLCSSCGTYHENWNLFLHIREIHNRHVCLYCIRLFPTAEKLSLHLEIKHDLEQNHFNSEEKLRSVSKGDGNSRFLMCCTCQHVFSEHERFSDHICTEYLQQCSLCGQKGRHLNNCKANPEKRSGKVKKKAKILPPPATATKSSNIQQRLPPTTTLIMPSPVTPATVCDSKYNNNQTVLAALPLSLQTATPPMPHLEQEFSKQNGYSELAMSGGLIQKPLEDYNYHSDDSTNMVIDETCSNTNYANEMAGINPFKALDERERLQEEVQKVAETKTTLPPDRVPEAIPEPKPLIVPKIKLRVPKEFQKAVESEISSTDSDEEDDGEEEEEEDDEKEQNTESPLDNYANANDDVSEDNDDKDNTQDMDESNSNLNRILQEIEKTKMDIRRTKEMLEPMNNLKRPSPKVESPKCPTPVPPSPCPVVESEENLDNFLPLENSIEKSEPASWDTPERGMYSPTPPPTPNSVWSSPLHLSQDSPDVLQAVSERENIENMEKESEQAKDQPSETEKMDTSQELDVSSIPKQEESAMEVDDSKEENHETLIPSTPAIEFPPLDDAVLANQVAEELKPEEEEDEEIEVVKEILPPADGIELANEDVLITDLLLDRPLEKFEIVEFVRLCVRAVYALCLYCNHARRIAVNGHSLVLHLLAQHRFAATVDSITAEELLPSTIVAKLKSFLPDLEEHYFNLESYCTVPPKENNTIACNERTFECFQCRFSTKMHKDLYLHNRKMHLKTAILCYMCRANFFSFSEILCHICPGMANKVTVFDIKFRCCLCDVDEIPSPFRLMVHLRKKHFACDICLEDCREQGRLSSHVWKHKLHHLCYRCGIAYRNKMDITKHLFWKHGTESIICKRCLQKRWRHVYHFCVPPTSFVCDLCNLCFSKATYLKVHKRVHTGDFRYPCTEESCEEKFISRKLLLKHSVIHAPPEVKVEEKIEDVAEPTGQPEGGIKVEETPNEEKAISGETTEVKEDVVKEEEKKEEKPAEPVSKRKKKKNRNKESLEDLNLIAPNLSESDSSDDSDGEKPKTDDTDALVPNVMLSPPSEDDKDEEKEATQPADNDAGKIMDIWENFKSFQASQQPKQEEDDNQSLSESNYPTPILHVACSDHDYCAMYKIRPRVIVEEVIPAEPKQIDVLSDTERDLDASEKREKSISPNKKKRKSTGSGSSSSDSSSGSDSSCSCGSNCSCSSSGSSSNSSSSSDENSDSSTSEGRRRIAAKKQSRAERNRLKSESSLKVSHSESVDVVVEDKETIATQDVSKVLEPVIIETDLETAESDTDEEFYDEHPQKLASEMLAQKRLQLQEQMRLSPSHNFDIMENSRPSTPSLPEEMVKEKKVKLKKKKRDRKSTSKSQAVPPIKLNLSVQRVEIANEQTTVHETSMQVPEVDLVPPYDLIASPGVAEPPVAQQPPLSTPILQNNTLRQHIPFVHSHSRMSEGSSCSDADNSLKRSKRARRPNKFYGYTSDDENMPGTPLLIGTRTFKPQPPPQLTWRKEDLPAPSKSILLNKQPRSPRTPKTPGGVSGSQVKKRSHQKSSAKKKQHKLPPIPTLKIRPSKIGIVPALATTLPPPLPPPPPSNNAYSSSRDDSDDSDSSDDDLELPASSTLIPAVSIPLAPPAPVKAPTPPPPPPQASVFNQKIPPALLPNPDFATLQYFKRNNIRYPIRPPAGARQPRDGESVYCYCRCPYDEVSEMIACDGESCLIEWFHFECVGIMVAPQGKWFCAECRPKYSNELYPKV